jgi:hypothetical protein
MRAMLVLGTVLLLIGLAFAGYVIAYNYQDTFSLVIGAIFLGTGLAILVPKRRKWNIVE